MQFNSVAFLIFFPIVTFLFYLLKHKYRWLILLTASCGFYMYFIPQYIFILFTTILIDYIAAIYIEKSTGKKRKRYLIISIVSTCLVLFIFKYYDFFNENIHDLCGLLGIHYREKLAEIILPIGLSFHTFQSLSYVIEVYKDKQKAEKHFGIYSLYVMFYPQLVTGPIERPQHLLVQLREEKTFQYVNFVQGLRLILFGLFIKMVVADNLGEYVDKIYGDPTKHNSLSILLGMFFYSFQIYGDFYGYSCIAVGCAKAMGYNLIDNFRNPYFAVSLSEFWKRWHISLSTWFRDYVYFSLGGNKVRIQRWIINILIVFVLSGFWHGAKWTFVFWGLAHGIILILETLFNKLFKISSNDKRFSVFKILNALKTFVIVTFLWVLFRASDLKQVGILFGSLFKNIHLPDIINIEMMTVFFFIFFIILDTLLYNSRFDRWCGNRNILIRWSLYIGLLFLILVFSNVNNFPFIYFQF